MFSKIKNQLIRIIYKSNIFLNTNNILLESYPDCTDNTRYVFDELIKRNIADTHKIFWVTNDWPIGEISCKEKICYVKRNSLRAKFLMLSSKYIIDCNNYIFKRRHGQFRIYLGHGAAIKMPYEYSGNVGKINYTILLSEFFKKPHSLLYKTAPSQLVITGHPRNDSFFRQTNLTFFPKIKRTKTIIWMPTYRNHKDKRPGTTQTGIFFPYGVPCIEKDEDLIVLNKILRQLDTLLVIKLHPAEDDSSIQGLHLSNVKVIKSLPNNNTLLYDLLANTDALITDYSSVYYDYLLTHKPIGLAIPDIKDFTKTYQLVEKNYTSFVKGNYIYDLKDLLTFIRNVASGKNPAKKDMEWALNRYHTYQDGNSAKRVVDLLIKEMEKDK